MSLTINVRPAGATSGGETKTLPADGDNGNQEIDTQKEAEAALAFLAEGSKNVVQVGGREYTREQLISIRDANAGAPAPKAQEPADKVAGEGVSHGFYLQGKFSKGLGDRGHSGPGVNVGYVAGVTLLNGNTRLFLDPSIGFSFVRASANFAAPNGEAVNSALTGYGASGGVALRLVPSVLDRRLSLGAGATVAVGGFSTADSKAVSLPNTCTPDDFGRGECEPNAGPRTGNAGTQGLINFDAGSARGTSGAFVAPGVDLNLGVDILRGDWGTLAATGTFNLSRMVLLPSDGHGFSYTQVGGLLGVRGNFGGGSVDKAAEKPAAPAAPVVADKDGDGVPDAEDKCPEVKGTKDNAGCPNLEASVTSTPASLKAQDQKFSIGVSVKSNSKLDVTVALEDASGKRHNSGSSNIARKGDAAYPFDVPTGLKSGKYKLIVTMEDLKTGVTKVEEKEIVIVENVSATLHGSFGPGQPPALQNVKVNGLEKLEGITYVVEAADKDGKPLGAFDSKVTGKTITLGDKGGKLIKLEAPNKKGFQKDVTYTVKLKNKDGFDVWTGSFVVGQQAVPQRRRGAK